jgi:hypothetical protein
VIVAAGAAPDELSTGRRRLLVLGVALPKAPRMTSTSPDQNPTAPVVTPEHVLKVRSPHDVLAVVPTILGFHPSHSLVVIAISGPRNRVRFATRVDVPKGSQPASSSRPPRPPSHRAVKEQADALAAVLLPPLQREQPHAIVVVGYQAPRELLQACATALRTGLSPRPAVHDVLLVDDGRFWSLVCADTRCCPSEGTPVDVLGSALLAEAVSAGVVVLPDRAALYARVQPPTGAALQEAGAAMTRARTAVARRPDAAGSSRADVVLAMLDRALTPVTGAPMEAAQPAFELDVLATVLLALEDGTVRDAVYHRIAAWPPDDAVERLLREMVTGLPAPDTAVASAMLAMAWYCRGDGAGASVALEPALVTDPTHPAVTLVSDILRGLIDPRQLRPLLRRATAPAVTARRDRQPHTGAA